MTADLACQMSSCLCQDYTIFYCCSNKIFYTLNAEEYILFCLCLKQSIKQAFTNIQQPQAFRYFFDFGVCLGKFSSFNGNLAHAQQISQLLGNEIRKEIGRKFGHLEGKGKEILQFKIFH